MYTLQLSKKIVYSMAVKKSNFIYFYFVLYIIIYYPDFYMIYAYIYIGIYKCILDIYWPIKLLNLLAC